MFYTFSHYKCLIKIRFESLHQIQLLLLITTTIRRWTTKLFSPSTVAAASLKLAFFSSLLRGFPPKSHRGAAARDKAKLRVPRHWIKHDEGAEAPTGIMGGGVAGRARTGAVAREGVPRAGLTCGGAGDVAEGPRLAGETLRRVGNSCWEGKQEGQIKDCSILNDFSVCLGGFYYLRSECFSGKQASPL